MDTKVKKAAFKSSRSLINYRREHTAFTLQDRRNHRGWERTNILFIGGLGKKCSLPSLSTPSFPLQVDRKRLGCRIILWIPRSTDNYALQNYFLNLFECRGGLSHFQSIKVNYTGKYCCLHGVWRSLTLQHLNLGPGSLAAPSQIINASAGPAFDSAI